MKDHFVQVPVTLFQIRHSREFIASPSGYLYLLMLSWAWRKKDADVFKNTPERIKHMIRMYESKKLGLVSSIRDLVELSGLSKSAVENALNKLEGMGFIKKEVLENRHIGTYYQMGIINESGKGETTFLKQWCDLIDTDIESDVMFAGILMRTIFGPDPAPIMDEQKLRDLDRAEAIADRRSEAAFRVWFRSKAKRRAAAAYFNDDDSADLNLLFRVAREMGSKIIDDIIESTKLAHSNKEYLNSLGIKNLSPSDSDWNLMIVIHVTNKIVDGKQKRRDRIIPDTNESSLAAFRRCYALDKSFYEWENK